jgi:hypothetical protein
VCIRTAKAVNGRKLRRAQRLAESITGPHQKTLNPHLHAKPYQQVAIETFASPQNCWVRCRRSDGACFGTNLTTIQRYFREVEANLSGLNLLLLGSIVVPKKA